MCYSTDVHKPFYASGFLYHSASGQILLQQLTYGDNTQFALFREKSQNGKDPQTVFQHCVEKALGIPIKTSTIHPVYDYIHHKLGEQFIFFVEVHGATPKKYDVKNKSEWLALSKLSKHAMSEQTRHDITIGERVIRSLFEAAHPQPKTKRH